jgi:hypothetical protein
VDEPCPTPNPTSGAGARPAPAVLASSPREAPVAAPSRAVIEDVQPAIDGGRFPVKRTVGETVDVGADVFADGHDKLTAVLRYRLVPAGAGQAAVVRRLAAVSAIIWPTGAGRAHHGLDLPSIINHRLSTIDYRPSTIDYRSRPGGMPWQA